MTTYAVLKLVHVFAVILFLGNIITGVFWMRMADRTRDLAIICFAMRGIIRSDKWFTIPGVIVITAGGIAAAIEGGLPLLRTGWIFWSLVMFTISGIVFSVKLAPLQREISRVTANSGEENEFNWTYYSSRLRQWEIWGLIAILTPLAALVMMVLKLPVKSVF